MIPQTPFKRLILRAVLNHVHPMVIRVVAVPDYLDLPNFDDVFRTILGWDGLGFLFRVHGQEFTSFRRRTRSHTLRDFQLRPREKFLYTCGAIDLWEWDIRLLDRETGADGDAAPLCLGGRGASPPEEPLRVAAPLSRLPWDIAKDQFGVQGADFLGVMSTLLMRSAKDQFRSYVIDPARLPGTLPLPAAKDQSASSRILIPTIERGDATGISPTRPSL